MRNEGKDLIVQSFSRRCPYCNRAVSYDRSDLKTGENSVKCPSCQRIYVRVEGDLLEKEKAEPIKRSQIHSSVHSLSTPIQFIKGVGPKLAQLLEKKGVRTVGDALHFLPRGYEDRRNLRPISELKTGKNETGFGEILASGIVFYQNRRKKVFEAAVGDGTGVIRLKWFRGVERYFYDRFKKGRKLIFSGEVRWFKSQKEIHHPDIEIVDGDIEKDLINFKRIVPIYSETEGLHQRTLRRLMKNILEGYADELRSPIPSGIIERQEMTDLAGAFRRVHFPGDEESVEVLNLYRSAGHHRIIFEEFFLLELGLALKRKGAALETGVSFQCDGRLARRLSDLLPFQLTTSQRRVLAEIREDMEKPHPMNRLIQGDVGSGKTIVAFLACLDAIECGYQAAIMAPTEVLAEQHNLNLRQWLAPLGVQSALLTSSTKSSDREGLLRGIGQGDIPLVIGTHALIQEGVRFHRLGLAIVDEQHRFGVVQRGLLKKKGPCPDILVMTATPIPRTLAMTLYGDLDVSIIGEMPPGRMRPETKVFPESGRGKVYQIVEREVRLGRQAFIVYPLVEESERLDLKNATRMAGHLQKDIFPDFCIGLLHGRMKSDEKEQVMAEFKDGKTQILVTTTVIEVGIDVPNASVMVVEHAERFGLSQLHQLRGRIGRGCYPSKCLLLAKYQSSEEARARLRAMERTSDGFQIAEEDLALRGPGEFLGVRQSGLPDFRVAHLMRDAPILVEARREAFQLIQDDPELTRPSHKDLKEALRKQWSERLDLATIG